MIENIFIQIASYRDPELVPTIENILQKAKYPDKLTFGICRQYSNDDVWDNIDKFRDDNRFKIVDINYKNSKGACWARSETQKLWDDEKFTLQIDSHHRFVQDWDELTLNIWKSLNDENAILTGYPPNYSPDLAEENWDYNPQICNVYAFNNNAVSARPKTIPEWESRTTPFKALHISAGFIFGPGEINKKIPYDPNLYFLGEESNLTLRYYTHGYNLYHPHKLILHHYYTRKDNIKHWDDHKNWGELSINAEKRLNWLLQNKNNTSHYSLGTVRTLDDFKNYSGIDYVNKILHDDTIDGKEPPCSNSERGWDQQVKEFNKIITWEYDNIPKCDDPRFWGIFVCDQNKKALFRIDIENSKIPEIILGKINYLHVTFQYKEKYETPTHILIWPYSESQKWIDSVYLPLKIIE